MKLHCSQTVGTFPICRFELDYHMKLHCSQTYEHTGQGNRELDYHMKLHCSQTDHFLCLYRYELDYHMKLHCSQTSIFKPGHCIPVVFHIWLMNQAVILIHYIFIQSRRQSVFISLNHHNTDFLICCPFLQTGIFFFFEICLAIDQEKYLSM